MKKTILFLNLNLFYFILPEQIKKHTCPEQMVGFRVRQVLGGRTRILSGSVRFVTSIR